MNEEILQEDIIQDSENENIEMEDNSIQEEDFLIIEDIEEVDNSLLESPSIDVYSQQIIVDGVAKDYYLESYQQQLQTNLYLQILVIIIPTIYICEKLYRWFKSIFRVTF